MNASPSPILLDVIRQLLQKVEGTSYPNQDPASIENLKTYLRCRIAELEAEEGLRPPPPEPPERPPSLYRDDWWLPLSQRSGSISLIIDGNEDRPIRTRSVPSAESHAVNSSQV